MFASDDNNYNNNYGVNQPAAIERGLETLKRWKIISWSSNVLIYSLKLEITIHSSRFESSLDDVACKIRLFVFWIRKERKMSHPFSTVRCGQDDNRLSWEKSPSRCLLACPSDQHGRLEPSDFRLVVFSRNYTWNYRVNNFWRDGVMGLLTNEPDRLLK